MKRKQSGFTLVELIIVIAVLAILAGIAIPSYIEWLPKSRLNGAARQVMGDLMWARMQAVKENRPIGVGWVDETNYGLFEITRQPGPDDWDIIRTVNIDANYPDVTLGHATVAGGFIGGKFKGISFTPKGTRRTGGSIGLINPAGSNRVTVAPIGRVQIVEIN